MSVRNFDALLRPRSVAVIGASPRPHSVGATVMRNLLTGGFSGPIMPVHPKHGAVLGVLAYPDVDHLPIVPDVAVICTPPATVPGLIDALGRRGTRAAIVLTAGLRTIGAAEGKSLQQQTLDAARPHLLRILGPNCVGLLVPGLGLNASFAPTAALAGNLAFVSQSGALCTSVLDWARAKGIGFSHFVSLGDSADVDFGDMLDYLGSDPSTRAILLYIESIKNARKFMSAGRAAARNKPVLAVKSGRVPEGASAASPHTGALAGSDEVYDAAIRRCGMLRVFAIGDLFAAVETLGHARGRQGDRLAIMTNGGGPGVMATDALVLGGGVLARLAPETIERLNAALPAEWSRGNPVDIIGDAPIPRYAATLEALLEDPASDAVLLIHSPTAIVPGEEIAAALVETIRSARKPVLATWIGGASVAAAERVFSEAGIPTFDTPEEAVQGFQQIVEYRNNQVLLMETPPAMPQGFTVTETARLVVDQARLSGRETLTEAESKAVLAAYGIPVVETRAVPTAEEAGRTAEEIGFPVALKILSPQLSHKSDVGGVALDLESRRAVEESARAMSARIASLRPDAQLSGFSVQRMVRRPGAHELIVGAATDAIFGPVILFGQGGTAVEVVADRAISLPPLNLKLARDLVERTRVFRLLRGYRDRPAVDLAAVCLTLVKISQLITDVAEIAELDINPLLADARGVLALDARIRVAPSTLPGAERLAIRPYPQELEEPIEVGGRKVLLRPIRPEDEPQHHVFVSGLDPEDTRFRFFGMVRELPHSEMTRFTQIDYDREMAFIATAPAADGRPETLGVVRAMTDPNNERAEFAIVVQSALKGHGLGRILLQKMIAYCRHRGTRKMIGNVLSENQRMLALARTLGFEQQSTSDPAILQVTLDLSAQPARS